MTNSSTPVCVCGVPVHNGYLCHRCTIQLGRIIATTPVWADQLDIVRLRLTRFTSGNEGRRNRETPLPYNIAASNQARELDKLVRKCAGTLGAPTDILAHRLGIVAAWLAVHVNVLRKRPDAVTWFEKIEHAASEAEKLTDRPPDVWYAGRCPCGKDLYPLTTAEIVICPDCAHSWSVTHRRAELLRQVRDIIAPGPDIARALTVIGETPITPERLRKWRHAGKLRVRKFNPGPPPTNSYRVGDVIDLVMREQARKNPTR